MNKPFDTQIIKLMAAYSVLSAAYASAMKWDFWRRQKIEDIIEDNIAADCGFCQRQDGGCSNCFLSSKKQNTSENCAFYTKVIFAFRAKDQQAYTQAANDLYYLILKIIDDLYKPKPEPKKEVFYHKGQKFHGDKNCEFVLASIGNGEMSLIMTKGWDVGNRWNTRKIRNSMKITQHEMEELAPSNFTLIEDKEK